MSEDQSRQERQKRTLKKFSYRGIDLPELLNLDIPEFSKVVHARARRRLNRGLNKRPMGLIKKLRAAKEAAGPNEKPAPVKTHLRNMIIVPEMIGSVLGVYNGKAFGLVEVKPEMIGHYLGEFSITYIPTRHGRPGLAASHTARFIALK